MQHHTGTNHIALEEGVYILLIVLWIETQILTSNPPSTFNTVRQTPTAESTRESRLRFWRNPRQALGATGRGTCEADTG